MEKELYDRIAELQGEHWWFIARKRFVSEILKNNLNYTPKRILDIGCGCGSMINFLNGYAAMVVGLDDSEYALKFCKLKGNNTLIRATTEKLPFLPGSFDLITSFEVLSHKRVGDDITALKELYRICKKGGSIIIVDSAFNFLKSKHDEVAHAIRRYTLKELYQKLEIAGFVVKRATYLYMCPLPVVAAVRAFKKIFFSNTKPTTELNKTPQLLNMFMNLILSIEALILRKINLPFGISVLCLANKV